MNSHPAQKVTFVIALACYVAAAGCAVAALTYDSKFENDPIGASMIAAVVFFIGCGVVLHVIGKARLNGLMSGREFSDHD